MADVHLSKQLHEALHHNPIISLLVACGKGLHSYLLALERNGQDEQTLVSLNAFVARQLARMSDEFAEKARSSPAFEQMKQLLESEGEEQ